MYTKIGFLFSVYINKGSATSFDHKSDIVNNDDESGITSQESDIEVISERSESSVEVLHEELDMYVPYLLPVFIN